VTVPVLWTGARSASSTTNPPRSSDANREFDPLCRAPARRSLSLRISKEIDRLNERVYRTVNNGVYRAGFATAQDNTTRRSPAVRHARLAGKAPGEAALAGGTRLTEAGRAALHDAGALRRRLLLHSSAICGGCGYPETMALHAKVLCAARLARTVDLAESNPTYSQHEAHHPRRRPQGPGARFSLR